jgi:HD-like signal output (HDOD) protein
MLSWLRGLFGRRSAPRVSVPPPMATPSPGTAGGVARLRAHRRTAAAALAGGTGAGQPIVDALSEMLEGPLVEAPDADAVAALEARILDGVAAGGFGIPPFPSAAARVLELVQRPQLDLNELVRILHWEPAVVAEILVVANSAFHKRDAAVDDLRTAILSLGVQHVGAIATGVSARSLFEIDSRAEFDLFPDLWMGAYRETLVVAFAASWLAQGQRVPRYDRVFLRAVLTGTGRTIALRALAAQLLDGRLPEMPPAPVIAAAIDRVHERVAAVAIAGWALPPTITQSLDPSNQAERDIVALVSSLFELRRSPRQAIADRTRELARAVGLDDGWLRVTVRECQETYQRVAATITPPRAKARKGAA